MALFPNQGQQGGAMGAGAGHPSGKVDVNSEVRSMRSAGLTDDQILSELKGKGVKENMIISALGQLNHEMPDMSGGMSMPNQGQDMQMGAGAPSEEFRLPTPAPGMQAPQMGMPAHGGPMGAHPGQAAGHPGGSEDLYERIEEIAEELIDEKWDDLIKEVQKIITWKNKSESRLAKLESDVSKLAEDFKTLHQGVLGKVEEYDKRMTEVGTELKAVGKVFKDVIPVFTENVKELRDVTKSIKKK